MHAVDTNQQHRSRFNRWIAVVELFASVAVEPLFAIRVQFMFARRLLEFGQTDSSIVVGDTRSFSLKKISYSPTTILLRYFTTSI